MFEKEAKEYIKKNNLEWELECNRTSPIGEVNQAYQKGAEFGYNKAKEEDKWHFVKDGDLPNTEFGRVDVTVAYINAYDNPCKMDCCFDGTNFIYWSDRQLIGWKRADIFGKIYAWKYPEKLPELPKEIKENDR